MAIQLPQDLHSCLTKNFPFQHFYFPGFNFNPSIHRIAQELLRTKNTSWPNTNMDVLSIVSTDPNLEKLPCKLRQEFAQKAFETVFFCTCKTQWSRFRSS